MTLAVADGGIAPEQVGYISAHGTSTPQNDADETAAIRLAFAAHADKLAVSSQKSMTGHSIGGAGTIECAATALCLHHRVLTPTINYETPDPACSLDYVPNEARPPRSAVRPVQLVRLRRAQRQFAAATGLIMHRQACGKEG